jgi:hypothetical protein
MSLCEEKLCKNNIYDKKTHIKKMLEIKKKNPGNFEENAEYKHLAQCLTNIDGYFTKNECDLYMSNAAESSDINMEFIIKNLYSSDPDLRKRAENMYKNFEQQQNKPKSKPKDALSSEEEVLIRKLNPKLFEKYERLKLGNHNFDKKTSEEKECEKRMNENYKERQVFNKKIKELEKEIKLWKKKHNKEKVDDLEKDIDILKSKVEKYVDIYLEINEECKNYRKININNAQIKLKEEIKKTLDKIKLILQKHSNGTTKKNNKTQNNKSSNSTTKKIRCPNGYRRNKNGDCVPK